MGKMERILLGKENEPHSYKEKLKLGLEQLYSYMLQYLRKGICVLCCGELKYEQNNIF